MNSAYLAGVAAIASGLALVIGGRILFRRACQMHPVRHDQARSAVAIALFGMALILPGIVRVLSVPSS